LDRRRDIGGAVARIHLVLSDKVISAIDTRVGKQGRSRFLEEAAVEKLDRLDLEQALVSTGGIVNSTDYPEFEDQDSINDWVRAQRRTDGAF